MKKITLLFLLTALTFNIGYAQCDFDGNQYPATAITLLNDGSEEQVSTCNYYGEYSVVLNLNIGEEYIFDGSGGFVTLIDNADGSTVLTSGASPLVWTSTVTEVEVHWAADAGCGTDTTCHVTSVTNNTTPPPPAPECATTPSPVDGATGVPVGNVTFTWEAPTTGPVPTSYNLYAGETPSGDDYGLIGNYTDTEAFISLNAYDALLYWKIVPLNGITEATGCPVWSFTTESAPPAPSNDDCANANSLVQEVEIVDPSSATPTSGTIASATDSGLVAEECNGFTGNANDDVWYSFVALTETVNITYEINGSSIFDGVAQLYSGTCGSLVNIGCADNSITTAPVVEEIQATGLMIGETYYTRIYQYGTEFTGSKTFDIKIWSSEALSVDQSFSIDGFSYYPNPVTDNLTLKAQKNIQNVEIYNMLGQKVLNSLPNTVESNVDMSGLKSGAYFVKVTVGDTTETIRVIRD